MAENGSGRLRRLAEELEEGGLRLDQSVVAGRMLLVSGHRRPSSGMGSLVGNTRIEQEGFGGKPDLTPPPCPWPDETTALRRDREVKAELERTDNQAVA